MAEQIKILLVEDSTTQALILKRMLEGQSYAVSLASSGEQALELLETDSAPDMVLADINLPEIDGYELTRRIKSHEQTNNLLVVLFISLLRKEDIFLILECGADNFVFKTYDEKYLFSRIMDILDTVRLRKEADKSGGGDGKHNSQAKYLAVYDAAPQQISVAPRTAIDLLLSAFDTNVYQRKSSRKAPAQ